MSAFVNWIASLGSVVDSAQSVSGLQGQSTQSAKMAEMASFLNGSTALAGSAIAALTAGVTSVEIQIIANKFAFYGLTIDIAASATNLYNVYSSEGFESKKFQDAAFKLGIQAMLGGLAYGSALTVGAPAFAAAAVAFTLGGLLFDTADFAINERVSGYFEFFGFSSPLASLFRDPLIIDLDGDGIELTALGVAGEAGASNVFFDYDGDGFAERTGWVKPDDGILVYDRNGNGQVDGAGELFGSPNQDGYAVLETLDSNGDGVIDAALR
jgi:hypothetical protein